MTRFVLTLVVLLVAMVVPTFGATSTDDFQVLYWVGGSTGSCDGFFCTANNWSSYGYKESQHSVWGHDDWKDAPWYDGKVWKNTHDWQRVKQITQSWNGNTQFLGDWQNYVDWSSTEITELLTTKWFSVYEEPDNKIVRYNWGQDKTEVITNGSRKSWNVCPPSKDFGDCTGGTNYLNKVKTTYLGGSWGFLELVDSVVTNYNFGLIASTDPVYTSSSGSSTWPDLVEMKGGLSAPGSTADSAVPEPGTWALAATGMVMLAFGRFHRGRTALAPSKIENN